MNIELRTLTLDEINDVSGGFVCGGLCILGAFAGAVALGSGSVAVGRAVGEATG